MGPPVANISILVALEKIIMKKIMKNIDYDV